ncbi:MAG: bactofilin family protein [Bdellovibrionales bacterium]
MSQTEQKSQTEAQTDAASGIQYQPAAATGLRSGGGYPGAYQPYGSAATQAAKPASASDRRLTIGAGITMSGEIESCDYLLVEGTVEAALKGASFLDIAESGIFYGTVEIEEATIAGRFEGDITVHGRLTLREGATLTGTVSYKELEIEAGAIIDGKLTPLNAAPAAVKKAPKQEAAPAKAAKIEAQPQQPANNDGELFSKAATAAE